MVGEKGFRKFLWVSVFLLPSFAGVLLFSIYPILDSLRLTLFEWDLLSPARYIGLDNFQKMASDANFHAAILHTFAYLVGYIPTVLALGLGLALILNTRLRGKVFFRAAYFLPVVSPWVAVALLWRWIFNSNFGLMNYFLQFIGIHGPAWLSDPVWAMPAIIITSVWKDIGFVMVLFLAGLQNISEEYYEAASLDGANAWQRFRHISLPLLSPTTFFITTILLINSFQVFDQVWVMTGGGPAGATSVIVQQIVRNAFDFSRMGYAATLSWFLFAIIFAVTLLQMKIQNRWVTYD
ncbi:MAG: sugar ABC transporter permease [Anaerolineales bacterium]|jgi:multiple sugar transport system permease protein